MRRTALSLAPVALCFGFAAPALANEGRVSVDGNDYRIERLRLCEPHEIAGGTTVELELQGDTRVDGERAQIDLGILSLAGGALKQHSVSWSGPEGVFGNDQGMPSDEVITLADGRASGEATLSDAFGSGETVEVRFDLPLPTDTFACR